MTNQNSNATSPKFNLGTIVATPGELDSLEKSNQSPHEFLQRHVAGDWGDLCDEDKEENELSIKEGFRILSAYQTKLNEKIWIITEADRSATTILLPNEY